MNEAIKQMLERYGGQTRDDHVSALREILQQIALLGLWRSKFFEHAAFYGGTAFTNRQQGDPKRADWVTATAND